ncbi:ImmA/IrrE family metallo-endopeptidase [Caminicella sporogenes]|uniref:ImmA/IrrE family metallo-endopeptidase n=1 Tax=Caminicella sporogenes TaxID=166485 RepID=UPI00253FE028|nr:ImmA/IrrE family metallo-endopeptidase [Caminicella sporogenes]WIF95095.1 ImmA/IrrE family metallo-endopeptidase [Caminicella sporogenes]
MASNYNPHYYTLDYIPKYRQEFIDTKLNWFIKTFEIYPSSWPIDCIKIIEKIFEKQKIPFVYDFISMPDKVDALAVLKPHPGISPGVYMMLINKNKVRYPYVNSRDRRANFTIAHELGHIVLGHLLVPRTNKTDYELYVEEQEAEEFAGRFLMPQSLILNSNFISIDSVAEHFIVSKQAVWKRLNHLKRLDLLKKEPQLVCKVCGNKKISPYAEYCCICGNSINDNTNGVIAFDYSDGYSLNKNNRVLKCPQCCNEEFSPDAQYCRICGLPLFNYCTNLYYHQCYHKNPGNARFCEICGSPTLFYSQNLLSDWQQAQNIYYEKLVKEDNTNYFFKVIPSTI